VRRERLRHRRFITIDGGLQHTLTAPHRNAVLELFNLKVATTR
jgi:hypothetical protein